MYTTNSLFKCMPGALLIWAAATSSAGCFIDKSKCLATEDCPQSEYCDLVEGTCTQGCSHDDQCLDDGKDIGKRCLEKRCKYAFDERVPAPDFCLKAANAKSAYYGKKLCLSELRTKVVLMFFGLTGCSTCGMIAATLEEKGLNPLRKEGLEALEFLAVTRGADWDGYHDSRFDQVAFPVLPDTDDVFNLIGAEVYDVMLVDKRGRLVSRHPYVNSADIDEINQEIRGLYAE